MCLKKVVSALKGINDGEQAEWYTSVLLLGDI